MVIFSDGCHSGSRSALNVNGKDSATIHTLSMLDHFKICLYANEKLLHTNFSPFSLPPILLLPVPVILAFMGKLFQDLVKSTDRGHGLALSFISNNSICRSFYLSWPVCGYQKQLELKIF